MLYYREISSDICQFREGQFLDYSKLVTTKKSKRKGGTS